ncbi:hypothetical protein KC726_05655 [Candidatus Woesebacteria bacterium]|nr:hypothetical protein [Candidatus Woesebacteria bacterium]
MDKKQEFGSIDSIPSDIKTPSETDTHHSYRMIIISTLIFFVALGAIFLFRNQSANQQLQTLTNTLQNRNTTEILPTITTPKIVDMNEPWVRVKKGDSLDFVKAGDQVTFIVEAFSKDADIAGFDILLKNDEALDIVSVSSLLSDFTVQTFPSDTHTTVTGYKDLQSKQSTVFNNTAILSVVAKAKQSGEASLIIESLIGKEKTQFIENNSEATAIYPQNEGVSVTVAE